MQSSALPETASANSEFMDVLIFAFERIIKLLEKSTDSIWANYGADEALEILRFELKTYKQTKRLSPSGKHQIHLLFLPTGALQEISIDNGWGDEYLEISSMIDKFV
jgi:hypothetical protein